MNKVKDFFLSGRSLDPASSANVSAPGKCSRSWYKLLPWFFFLNGFVSLLVFTAPFSVILALVFCIWGVTNLLFCHCHRCRDAMSRRERLKESTSPATSRL